MNTFWSTCGRCWRTFILVLAPILLSPLLIYGHENPISKCGFVVLLMATYWSTEALPVAVTALLPVVLLPLLELSSTEDACSPYLQEPNMVFVGSLIFAIAVESSSLHKRIALLILKRIGGNFEHLMLGFMLVTMFVACWIINTAAAAMMLPIADAILEEIFPEEDPEPVMSEENNNGNIPRLELESNKLDGKTIKQLKKMFYLSIAYSANIGGTSTLTSNGPNLILRFEVDSRYGGKAPIDYANWLFFSGPAAIVTVLCVWVAFRTLYLRKVKFTHDLIKVQKVIKAKYDELGPLRFEEASVLVLFFTLVFLWMFRDPQFIRGWATYFGKTKPRDATVVIAIAIVLFIIPARPMGPYPSPSLLSWPTVQHKLAWGVILLRGGGFSMATAVNSSGLSTFMGKQLAHLGFMSLYGIVITFSVITAFLTEFASNSATASVFLPVAAKLAISLDTNPLVLLIPITLSCSYAFILPVGTPANALVFDHAKLVPKDMLVPGLVTQFICLAIMFVNLYTVGFYIFDLGVFPDWAQTSSNSSMTM